MGRMAELYEESRQEQQEFLARMYEQQALEDVAKACANDHNTFEHFLRIMWNAKQ